MNNRVFALAFALTCLAVSHSAGAELLFGVEIDGRYVPYEEHALYALPGSMVAVQLEGEPDEYQTRHSGRSLASQEGLVSFAAPASPGIARAEIVHIDSGSSMHLNIFAIVPATEVAGGRLDGYRIGDYPSAPLHGNPMYLPPRGFVRITEANAGTKISPNFSLDRFACKQSGSYPKYAVVQPTIVWKLERILAELKATGMSVDSLIIMSGYRTPYYNQAIGNVPYSRHVYGDAADIYIDESPHDGMMDDLNGDGRSNLEDARLLVALIDGLERGGKLDGLVGGLSAYGSTSAHGPFVHVDARGQLARW